MEKHILSKSTFIKGHQCLKALYLHKKRPFLRDRLSAEQLAKFKRGHQVGDLAQQLFPNGIDVSPKSPAQYQKAAIQTQELINQGEKVIYEATFQYNKVLIMLDILVKTETGWDAFEVKSSRSLSETYYTDASLQYYIITQSGMNLNSFSLVYVNENYKLEKDKPFDLNAYFIRQEVSDELKKRQSEIAEQIEKQFHILNEKHSPNIEVGSHCFYPYPCDFQGFCWKEKPNDIFKIPALSKEQTSELLDRAVFSLDDLKKQTFELPLVSKQIDYLNANQSFVDEKLKEEILASKANFAVFGYVCKESAIPDYIHFNPYQKQWIAYSISQNNKLMSHVFSGNADKYSVFISTMLSHLESHKQIVVFDKEECIEILDQHSCIFPEFKDQFNNLRTKLIGLKQWIEEGKIYFPGISQDIGFNETINNILKINSFTNQKIASDIQAVSFYAETDKNSDLNNSLKEEMMLINRYTHSKVEYLGKCIERLG
jgi:hypothetical protein